MNLLGNDLFSKHSSSSWEEDILIKKLLLTHDPDGRRLDSQLLLHAMEDVMRFATTSDEQVSGFHIDDALAKREMSKIEVVGSDEPLGDTINKISHEMLCKCSGEGNLHKRTMLLFDLLGSYKWDAKLVLVLAAFAISYGEFWLLRQLYPQNPMAVLVAMLKQMPNDIRTLKPQFRALSLLVQTMIDVTKCIIKFESLPFTYLTLDDEVMAITKIYIYRAAYWVTRSTLACSSQITNLTATKPEQVHVLSLQYSHSTVIAAWELSSLAYRLSSISSHLRQQVDMCHQQIETKVHQKLLNIFTATCLDNQEALHILFALKDGLPLQHWSTQEKLGVSELKDKVVILLFSKPELLPLEWLLFLVHQTYDHPQHCKLGGSYQIIWVPISDTWTNSEEQIFNFLSNSLPWYTVRQPWLLNTAVVNYVKQVWNYKDEPLMVVLDSQGTVTNSNAIDVVSIWGPRAYPFSSSREKELWQEEKWTVQLMIDEIDPLLTQWVQEGRNICIFGSENLHWIKEFVTKMKEIKNAGVQLEIVYVGKKNPRENMRTILAIINEEMHASLLSFMKIQFFWLRLESMRRSTLSQGKTANTDHILEEVSALLAIDDKNGMGWAVFGRGQFTDMINIQGRQLLEYLDMFAEWEENVAKLGFLGALRTAIEPTLPAGPCNHSSVIPYAAGTIEGTVICDKCGRIMKKFVVYE